MDDKTKRRTLFFAGLGILGLGVGVGLSVALVRHPVRLVKWYARRTLGRAGLQQHKVQCPEGQFSFFRSPEKDAPSTATVVLVHGLGGHAGNWFKTVSSLREHDVVVVDLPGHGDCQLHDMDWSHDSAFELFTALIDLATDEQPLILVGNSLGGWLSTLFALAFPEKVRRLVLVNSAGLPFEYDRNLLLPQTRDDARAVMDAVFGHDPPRVPGFLLDAMVRESQQSPIARALEVADEHPDVADRLQDLRVPTDIIWGTEDTLIPLDHAHRFHREIPDSQLHFLAGSGHSPQVADPKRFNRLLLEVLDRDLRRPASEPHPRAID